MRNSMALTGVTGYVGQNVRRILAKMNVPVVCLTQKSITARRTETVVSGESWVTLASLRALRKCSAMIHLAGVGRHIGGMGYAKNIELAQNAIDACTRAKIPKIVFVSGLGADSAATGYFASKLGAERAICTSNISHTIFRASYIVGRSDALTVKIRKLARARKPIVPGDGRYIIQPIHIDDACTTIIDHALSHNRTNKILDLVGPTRVSYRRFVSMIVGARAAKSIPLESAVRNAVQDTRAPYDIDELAILLGSFGGDYDTLEKSSKNEFRGLDDMLRASRSA